MCIFVSLAVDESADLTDTAQLIIFIRGVDDNFNVFQELLSLESLYGTTKGANIFQKLKLCTENFELDMNKLISICTDGAPAMVGKNNGMVALLEKFLDRPLIKYQ